MELIKKLIAGLLLPFGFVIACSACAEGARPCSIDGMSKLLSSDLSSYEKVQEKVLGQSSEGASIEYYYAGLELKAIKSVYYGETGKTEIEYRFKSPTSYAAKLTEYFYSAPIYMEGSELATTNESKYVVCGGELMRGVGDDAVLNHYERASKALKKAIDAARLRA